MGTLYFYLQSRRRLPLGMKFLTSYVKAILPGLRKALFYRVDSVPILGSSSRTKNEKGSVQFTGMDYGRRLRKIKEAKTVKM